MFSLRTEIQLQIAHRIAPIGKKGDALIHLEALVSQHLKDSSLGLLVITVDRGKTFGLTVIRQNGILSQIKSGTSPKDATNASSCWNLNVTATVGFSGSLKPRGAFWQDRYHATAIETGEHLLLLFGIHVMRFLIMKIAI